MDNLHLPPSTLNDYRQLADALLSAGFSSPAAQSKARLFNAAAQSLPSPTCAFFVPGRVEILGKHTDYAGGRSLLATLDRGFCIVARARNDAHVRITDIRTNEKIRFDLSSDLIPTPGHWSNYPMTVARRLTRNFPGPLRGIDAAFASDLPPAAGMSSSSGFLIACFLPLAHANALDSHPAYTNNILTTEDLAAYLATIENGQSFRDLPGDTGVGTFGGSEDHTAILCCQPQHLRQYAYCPLRFEQSIPFPPGHTLAIAVSGIAAEKTGSSMHDYNNASLLAAQAVAHWNHSTHRSDPHLAAAIASAADAPDRFRHLLADIPNLLNRFEHFYAENFQIIPPAADALARGDLHAFGHLVDRSQQLAETLLKNQIPQTVFLAHAARRLGASAASAFGAGFGGSVWALIDTPNLDRFLPLWQDEYRAAFPTIHPRAAFFPTHPAPAAICLCP